jgi:hypothetical protein
LIEFLHLCKTDEQTSPFLFLTLALCACATIGPEFMEESIFFPEDT